MPYTPPGTVHTPSSGVAPPAGWGGAVNDAFDWFGDDRPRARVYGSANISHTTSGSLQIVLFNSERYDVGGCHSTSVNTGRLTVPSGGGGLYDIGGSVRFAANATGVRNVFIRVNGSVLIAPGSMVTAVAGIDNDCSVATQYPLSAGDYVELLAFQNSGGALNMLAQGNYSPEFYFTWVCNTA